MKSCTIIVSHFESLAFLRACVRQLRKYAHPKVKQHIVIADQSGDAVHQIVMDEFGSAEDITVISMKALYSGYGIDYVMRYGNITTDYVCQLHVDAFPIHRNWLWLCINMIEDYNYSFVGQLHFETQPGQEYYYLLNKMFFSMSPTFNVAKTSTYFEMATEAGFTRFNERKKIDVSMPYNNDEWGQWVNGAPDVRGSDDDVVAFAWESNHRDTDKLALPVTAILGVPGEESGYGRIIDDIVFHFGFCRESIGVMPQMGEKYREWTRRINEGFSDELIEEMFTAVREGKHNTFPPFSKTVVWDGVQKKSSPVSEQINKRIEELKNGLD